jgi:hypothetical protein
MLEPSCKEEIARRVWILQIIVGSVLGGSVLFLVIATVVVREAANGGAPADLARIYTYLTVGFAVIALAGSLIIPPVVVARARRRIVAGTWRLPQSRGQDPSSRALQETLAAFVERTGDAGRLFYVLLMSTSVGVAILEGGVVHALVMYVLARSPVALIIAIALIIGQAAQFPTRWKVFRWIDDQLRLVEQERQFGR